jgi:hypothetical protein
VGDIPHLKALVERHKDQPFAIVGVNTDRDKEEYRRKVEQHGVTWRSAWAGSPAGELPRAWGIQSYPTVFVLDASHTIRHTDARGERLSEVVAELLQELNEGRE